MVFEFYNNLAYSYCWRCGRKWGSVW